MNFPRRSLKYGRLKLQHGRLACIVVFVTLLTATALHAAFEGFGSSTPGGSNGAVKVVTSLADSGPGTLRDALSGSNRRIIFAVGGTINLQSVLSVRGRSFITIDGSTAPAPGITLQGNGFYIRNSHDIVITHMRIRDSASDGITLWDGSYNVVIDHCSVTNSADGNIDITEDTRNVTVSWCIIGDTRPNWFALKTKGMLVTNFNKPPVTNLSLHHNLFINQFQRSPQIANAGLVDIRNNVIRDWGAYAIRMRSGATGNIVNNVFDTNNNPEDAVVLESDAGPVHLEGNLGPGTRNVNGLSTSDSLTVAPVTTDPPAEVEAKVLEGAGSFPRDQIDTVLAGPAASASTSAAYFQAVIAGGAAYTDIAGTQWNADKAYSSGSWGYVGGRTFKTNDSIANTSDDPLYRSERYGNFSYRFDVPSGLYEVTLHFAEIYHKSAGRRIFDVFIEDGLALDNLDIHKFVGHDAATQQVFQDVLVQDGQLNIEFVTVKDNAKVSAIFIRGVDD